MDCRRKKPPRAISTQPFSRLIGRVPRDDPGEESHLRQHISRPHSSPPDLSRSFSRSALPSADRSLQSPGRWSARTSTGASCGHLHPGKRCRCQEGLRAGRGRFGMTSGRTVKSGIPLLPAHAPSRTPRLKNPSHTPGRRTSWSWPAIGTQMCKIPTTGMD